MRSKKRSEKNLLRAVQLSGCGKGTERRKKRKTVQEPKSGKEPGRGDGPQKKLTISGGNDEGVPPVPIPNTEVKPFSADGTWLETARESRSLPDSNRT